MAEMVKLAYRGFPYWAADVRYWLRSRVDMFVYDTDQYPGRLLARANESLGVWDRQEGCWLDSGAGQETPHACGVSEERP